ncbi:MAG: glutamate synthase-related protein [Desulfobulbaceae bacterium]|nr:glutamate synthase-related protein [Desulfobulbaceae bacterium]
MVDQLKAGAESFIEEKDGCAIVAIIDKRGRSTHANITRTIDCLQQMGHRSGDIHGEGDGCGISTDIPRKIWAGRLAENRLSPHLSESRNFFVGHFMVPLPLQSQALQIISRIKAIFSDHRAELLCEVRDATRENELGPRARTEAPFFWQAAGIIEAGGGEAGARKLFELQVEIEKKIPEIHIASLNMDSVVFKLQGIPDMLPRYFPELLDENMRSVMTLGHSRYSTNTLPTVILSQPFSMLCHNGEINTIDRLRECGRALGIAPVPGGSDSQDLNRVIEGLVNIHDLDIMQALNIVFPAVYEEVDKYGPLLREVYAGYRWFFPCSAQGPAAVIARHRDCCLGSVDALGLRPLWFVESDYDYLLSSEKGVVDLKRTVNDPRPLGPGEKIAILGGRGREAEIIEFPDMQVRLGQLHAGRHKQEKYFSLPAKGVPSGGIRKKSLPWHDKTGAGEIPPANVLSAFGWQKYDLMIRKKVAIEGREVIGSLGYTGPLAAFAPEALPNIADYFKENVAVVTNPSIDREREIEHFSTAVILGSRPDMEEGEKRKPVGLELRTPLLPGGYFMESPAAERQWRSMASRFGTALLEDVLAFFTGQWRDPGRISILDATFHLDEGIGPALQALHGKAKKAVEDGAVILLLDDSRSFENQRVYLDPVLAVAGLNEYLIENGLRREAGIIVRSAAIRNLHDIMVLLGLGADALNPYLIWQVTTDYADDDHPPAMVMDNTMNVLQKGMEKVMSTMGIHELGGYGGIFSSIGLAKELAGFFRTRNFCTSDAVGLNFAELQEMARVRYNRVKEPREAGIYRAAERNPRVGKVLRQVAEGRKGYLEMSRELEVIETELPTGIRHLLALKKAPPEKCLQPEDVDITVGSHAMPLIIAAMSFGSQGENSFRVYARAARRANIICMNGEGGEIPDMLGLFRANRGQQIASGRFGVSMEFLNSADFLEIKIGQGAKPGEGGHLPGNKVTAMVAAARHCKRGTTLISPANHHDIYSIEDLAQIITELKTANPFARISVKIPVTGGVGTIAVGIAKAGADIINISGFEGGTGAAREHSKRNVGLPVEVGVSLAHHALLEAGLRSEVEIWADGGIRSGTDVIKIMLLGANRVGLGTAVLMGIGCISCRRCHLDRCPRGISTQLASAKDAEAVGVKGFKPRDIELEVENLTRLLNALGDEIRLRLGEMGRPRLQEIVGRADFLSQSRMRERIDVRQFLVPPKLSPDVTEKVLPWVTHKPLNYLTRLISDLTIDRFDQGEQEVHFVEDRVRSTDRAIGTYLAGAMIRRFGSASDYKAFLRLGSSVPGNGLLAFNIAGVAGIVEGGSQDGAAKGSAGGSLSVLKGRNQLGRLVDGSTGKSFAYGATGGFFIVQNMADSRACIRMSGAEVVFGARITERVNDEEGNIAGRAHLKGFAFEYMTGGRAVVLGDPGPWICAGMTGGVIYQCLYPEFDFDRQSIKRRLAKSSETVIRQVSKEGLADIRRMLARYIAELESSFQKEEAEAVTSLLQEAKQRFVMIIPTPERPPSAE